MVSPIETRACSVMLAFLAACTSVPEADLLAMDTTGASGTAFICEDGTRIFVPDSVGKTTKQCLGLECGGDFEAGSAECSNAMNNPTAGTCVEEFFACYKPSGACTASGSLGYERPIVFANGATYRDEELGPALFGAGSDKACAYNTPDIEGPGSIWVRYLDEE